MASFPEPDILERPAAPTIAEPTDPGLLAELLTDVHERGQVTVHCQVMTEWADMIRIWPSTYLVCRRTGHRSRLLMAEGIAHAPQWQRVPPGRSVEFTLIFEALPQDCHLFDLVEDIPDVGGFFSPGIRRNSMDVYHVEV